MDTQALVKDTSDATFMEDVIEASKTQPVLVDFWAPWCGPCRQLMPVLEKVVKAEGGKVKMVKVNIDENKMIAEQLRVQSVPTVYAFVNGQPVDGFQGSQPESELKKFIGKLTGETDVVAEALELVARAKDSLNAGDLGGAAQDYAQALQMNPDCAEAYAGLARLSLDSGDVDSARGLIDSVPEALKSNPDVTSVIAAIALTDGAPSIDDAEEGQDAAGELQALQARVDANLDDLDARLALAKRLAATGQNAKAVDQLLYSVEKNRAHDDEAARKFLLTIFEAEGVGSEISIDGRKRLAAILFA